MSVPVPDGRLLGGRFAIVEAIGGGAMGEVFRAHDAERGGDVALKILRDPEPDKVYRFKREFRALADAAHPNLVRLHELVGERDQWFFTMELVDGVDFLGWVRGPREPLDEVSVTDTMAAPLTSPFDDPGWPTLTVEQSVTARALRGGGARAVLPHLARQAPPLIEDEQWQRLRDGLRQLAIAVQFLHDRGTLHRDLKPSNVMVTRDGRVVVLDFGIVTELARPVWTGGGIAGTPAYMAPEIGVVPTPDTAADWYAVGVMLYEAMAGRRPFHGSISELIEMKRLRAPPAVTEFAIAAPPDLAALCNELLARDPGARPTGPDILSRLGARPGAVAGDRPTRTALIGREAPLAALRAAYEAVLAGEPRVVRVTGPSGVGKSALVASFLEEITHDGHAMVIAGRCYERESVPFKAVDDLVDDLCQRLARLPSTEIAGILPRRMGALARLFPGLERIEAVRGAPGRQVDAADLHEQRRAAFVALRELLVRLSARRPLVLSIDDGQWGDRDSAALLAEVFRAPLAPPALLLVSARPGEDHSGFVELIGAIDRAGAEVAIGDLAAPDARALAGQLLADAGADAQFAELVATESGGNPLFLGELVRYVATGAEARAVGLDAIVRARLDALPAPARLLAEVIAVAAWPVPRPIAAAAAGLADDAAAVDALVSARLVAVRTVRTGDTVEIIHDRIRAAVAAGLDDDATRAGHRRLADALAAEARLVEHIADHLAEHLALAGDRAAAGARYRQAAADAAAKLAFERAGRLYARAIELLEPTGAERADLHARLADACQNAGHGAASAGAYLVAARDVDRARSLHYRGLAAQQLLRVGHVDDGVTVLTAVLAEVGVAMPRSRLWALISLTWLRFRIRLRGLDVEMRSGEQVKSDERLLLETCWTAAVALGMCDTLAGAVFQARHLLEALRAGDIHHVVHALSIEAGFRSLTGADGRAAVDALAIRMRDLADRDGDRGAIAWSQGCHAFARYQLGEFRLARDSADASLAALEGRAGVWFERATCEMYRLWALYWLGDFRRLGERVAALRTQAVELGDLYSTTNLSIGLPAVDWLVRGRPDEGRRAADEAMQRWPHRTYHLQDYWHAYALAQIELYDGDPMAAWTRLRQTWRALGGALLRQVQMVRIEVLWGRGRAAVAAARIAPAERRRLVKDAAWCVRMLRRERRVDAEALALALAAAVRGIEGDREAAVSLLTSAADRAGERELGAVTAAARAVRGHLIGGERGAALLRDAEAWMTEQGVVDPAAFTRVLMPGFER
jgi:serine/threonine protein kinase/tetratricopeptide (TPR) repeat protein